MRTIIVSITLQAAALLAVVGALASAPARAQESEQKAGTEQVVEPQLDRRDVRRPRFPSNDVEIGVFAGAYNTQSFGANRVTGLRLGYHVTEDVFVETVYGRTKVTDTTLRQVLPSGLFPTEQEKLTYFNVSAGVNVLPGEVFIGENTAKITAVYLIGGLGGTSFLKQRLQTFNFGVGGRLMMADWVAVQIDARDHVFSLDLLGSRKTTHNIELTAGLTFFF